MRRSLYSTHSVRDDEGSVLGSGQTNFLSNAIRTLRDPDIFKYRDGIMMIVLLESSS